MPEQPDFVETIARDVRAPGEIRRRLSRTMLLEPQRQVVADDVLLVVSELVSNVVQHTDKTGRISVWFPNDGRVAARVEVADEGPALPRTPCAETPAGGRGLRLVALLSCNWGVVPSDTGKTVWSEVPWPVDAAADAAPSN